MSFETALAVLVRTRTDVVDVIRALCDLATIAHFLGQISRPDREARSDGAGEVAEIRVLQQQAEKADADLDKALDRAARHRCGR
jgi:hypothetical protein